MNNQRCFLIIRAVILLGLELFFLDQFINYEQYTLALVQFNTSTTFYLISFFRASFLCIAIFYRPRLFSFLALISHILVHDSYEMIRYGADVFSFYLLLALSTINYEKKKLDPISILGVYLLMGHLVIAYTFTGISKFQDSMWTSGESFLLNLRPDFIKTFFELELIKPLLPLWGYLVIAFQFSISLILSQKLRKYISIGFIFFHAYIMLFIHTYIGGICCACHFFIYFYKGNIGDDLKGILKIKNKVRKEQVMFLFISLILFSFLGSVYTLRIGRWGNALLAPLVRFTKLFHKGLSNMKYYTNSDFGYTKIFIQEQDGFTELTKIRIKNIYSNFLLYSLQSERSWTYLHRMAINKYKLDYHLFCDIFNLTPGHRFHMVKSQGKKIDNTEELYPKKRFEGEKIFKSKWVDENHRIFHLSFFCKT